jgi:hypothetical protein
MRAIVIVVGLVESASLARAQAPDQADMHATLQAADGQIGAADLERLTKLTDAQLKRLTELMARHVKALKAEITPLKGCGQI